MQYNRLLVMVRRIHPCHYLQQHITWHCREQRTHEHSPLQHEDPSPWSGNPSNRKPNPETQRKQSNHNPTLVRQFHKKSWKMGDQSYGAAASLGAGSLLILKITRSGCTSQLGGLSSAISMALMPSAHTSTYKGKGLGLGYIMESKIQ